MTNAATWPLCTPMPTIVNVDPSAPNSHAVRITESGVIVGNALKGFGTCNSWVAAIYVEDPSKPGTFKRTDLQPAPGGDGKVRCEYATGANESLQVVGMMQNSLFGHLGAFWNNDAKHTLTLLQPFPGDFFSNAWGSTRSAGPSATARAVPSSSTGR